MIDKPKRTELQCDECGYALLALEDKVFCSNNKCPKAHEGNLRQVRPRGLK